jgi:hypothetical protein
MQGGDASVALRWGNASALLHQGTKATLASPPFSTASPAPTNLSGFQKSLLHLGRDHAFYKFNLDSGKSIRGRSIGAGRGKPAPTEVPIIV